MFRSKQDYCYIAKTTVHFDGAILVHQEQLLLLLISMSSASLSLLCFSKLFMVDSAKSFSTL